MVVNWSFRIGELMFTSKFHSFNKDLILSFMTKTLPFLFWVFQALIKSFNFNSSAKSIIHLITGLRTYLVNRQTDIIKSTFDKHYINTNTFMLIMLGFINLSFHKVKPYLNFSSKDYKNDASYNYLCVGGQAKNVRISKQTSLLLNLFTIWAVHW